MNTFIIVIVVGSIFIASWISDHYLAKIAKQMVYDHLTGREATQIVVNPVSAKHDKDDFVYDVKYIDRRGACHQTQCKVHANFAGEGQIFWLESPEV